MARKRLMTCMAVLCVASGALAGDGWAQKPSPTLGVVYDCAFPSFIGGDYEQGGIVFVSKSRYKYAAKVKRQRLAGTIRKGSYEVAGKTYGLPAMTFLTGPKLLRPQRDDEQRSFFDRAKPYYVGIWAQNAIDLPWDCYRVGSKQWREREKQQQES